MKHRPELGRNPGGLDGASLEHAVLVTNLEADLFTLAQHYRDRGDAENNFDELKNQ